MLAVAFACSFVVRVDSSVLIRSLCGLFFVMLTFIRCLVRQLSRVECSPVMSCSLVPSMYSLAADFWCEYEI